MSYKINFYDKDQAPVTISDSQGAAVKDAVVSGKQAIIIDDNLYMTSGISSVKKDRTAHEYKTPEQLGLTSGDRADFNSEGYRKFKEMNSRFNDLGE